MIRLGLIAAISVALPSLGGSQQIDITPLDPGSIATAGGLAAWNRIYAVVSHPRCTNCHVGAQGVPMWEGLGYAASRSHGMNIRADESRVGAESIPCRTCHVSGASDNAMAHAAPRIDDAWRLPPAELAWLGKSSDDICAQLSNPDTNDGMTPLQIAEHLRDSAFVKWGFAPGGGREVPPGALEAMINAVLIWGAAGSPCAADQ